jgi:lysophospholipase L1-like esterase
VLVLAAVVIVVPIAVLGAEVELARHGASVPTPDVATLAAAFAPRDAAPDGVVRVLWLGDSTAAGVGASGPAGSVSSQVGDRLVAAGSHHAFDVRVIAKSGARIGDVVRDQLPRVASMHPDVVVISVGANDTIHLTRTKAFRDRYNALLDGLRARSVAADHVVVVGVPDMGAPHRLWQPLRALVGLRGRRLDRESERVAHAHHARYVDLFRATSHAFRTRPSTYFARDKYHPSDAGYALWAEAIAPAVIAAAG